MDATTDVTAHSFHGCVEDDVLVRGHGSYIADAPLPNQAYAYFVRSPHAFARVVSVETSGAAGMPGVIAVLTAADMDGIGNISRHPPLPGRNGTKLIVTNRPALAKDRGPDFDKLVKLPPTPPKETKPTDKSPVKLWAAFVISGTGK